MASSVADLREKPPIDDHCWHVPEAALAILTQPPAYPIVCCQCGRQDIAKLVVKILPGHGPHVKMSQLEYPAKERCRPWP